MKDERSFDGVVDGGAEKKVEVISPSGNIIHFHTVAGEIKKERTIKKRRHRRTKLTSGPT